MVSLLPFIDQAPKLKQIDGGDLTTTPPVLPGGSGPWNGWAAYNHRIAMLRCPTDTAVQMNQGNVNYVFCMGDFITNNRDATASNGMFACNKTYSMSDVRDGTSNTIAMSERVAASFGIGGNARPTVQEGIINNVPTILANPGSCLATAATITSGGLYTNGATVKGKASSICFDGQAEINGFTTVLPPNAPACIDINNGNADGTGVLAPPNGYHTGGVHCLMVDGAVRFINNSINTGNLGVATALGGASPYGVWGALGTRAGREVIGEF
jgi:prepilin-type processing-associated H-X9-DG protein